MKIVRATLTKGEWGPVPHATARDHRLSWRARGLLVELLSHADGWDLTIDRLVVQARQVGDATEGRAAMRAAVAELAELRYVTYDRRRDDKGHWTTVMVVSDTPQPEEPVADEPDRRTRNRTVGESAHRDDRRTRNRTVGDPGGRASGLPEGRHVKEDTSEKTNKNTNKETKEQRSEVECSPSGRFAPYGAGDENDHKPLFANGAAPQRTRWVDWRPEDYDRFVKLLGAEHVYCAGSEAGPEGRYPARELYEGMQRMVVGGGPKDWPGKYLETLYAGDPDNGITGWLARYGLEPA